MNAEERNPIEGKYPLQSNFGSISLLSRVFFLNWCVLFYRAFKKLILFLANLTLIQFIYTIVCLVMIVSCFYPWFYYPIRFFEQSQQLSSAIRWFFSLSILFDLFFLFIDFPFRKLIAVILLFSTLGIFTFGLLSPETIHISIKTSEYKIGIAFWVYGAGILLLLVLIRALSSSPMQLKQFKEYLLTYSNLK